MVLRSGGSGCDGAICWQKFVFNEEKSFFEGKKSHDQNGYKPW